MRLIDTDKLLAHLNDCALSASPGGGNGAPIPVTPSGTFSNDVTLKEGSNTITIVAKDKAGKTTTVTRTVKLDTAPPVIKSATITPNPVDCGKTFVISVEVTD